MPQSAPHSVLVIDDEQSIRAALKTALVQAGWQVEEAQSAEQALTILRSRRFDALLVDKNLPGQSGIDLVRFVRGSDGEVAIIVMTGYGSAESATELLHIGVSHYLQKPFDDIFAVSDLLQRAVASQQTSRALDHFRRAAEALGRPFSEHPIPMLIVGAGATTRSQLRNHMSRAGDLVREAESLDEVSGLLQREPPALCVIVSDGPDAVSLVRQARTLAPDAAIAVVLDSPDKRRLTLVTQLIAAGVRALLESPLEDKQLRERLDPVVARLRREFAAK